MTKIKITRELIEDLVFGFAEKEVRVLAAHMYKGGREIEFEIEGESVPNAELVSATVSLQTNAAGDRLRTMTFKALSDVTVHALQYGRPLCGFTNRLPEDWPAGHIWMGRNKIPKGDRSAGWFESPGAPAGSVLCAECLTMHDYLTKKEGGG